MAWDGLNPPYATIVADPPWHFDTTMPGFGNKPAHRDRRRLRYSTMSVETIAALPVVDLAAASAYLWLWTTNRHLEQAYGVVRSWGFDPVQLVTWCKQPRGIGPGVVLSQTTEHVLIGRRGKLQPMTRVGSTWWQWSRGAPSEKPSAFLDVVEQVSPGPYVELFARQPRLGWDSWGWGYERAAL